MEGRTSGSSPPVAHTPVNNIKGLNNLWGNYCEGNNLLTSSEFSFSSMTLPNMLSIWFCGDISKNISPYRMLRCKDLKQVKDGEKKL